MTDAAANPKPRVMLRRFRLIMTWALAAGVLAFLVVPLLLTFETSGTKTYREAAGVGATFLEVNGQDIHVEFTPYAGSAAEQSMPADGVGTGDVSADGVGADGVSADGVSADREKLFVLLHGFGASTFSWREVITPLSMLGDVVAYDRPAFGFSERPDPRSGENQYGFQANIDILNAILDEYATDREVVLVGHSAGGQLAAAFAEEFPKRVQRLILVDPAIYTTGGVPAGLRWILDTPQIDRLGPFLVQGIASSGLELLYRSYYNPTLVTDEILAGYQAPLEITGWEEALWEFTKAPRPEDVVERLSTIAQPTLLISGEDDTVVPVADTEKLATVIPNSTFMIITQSAHLPHEEQPQVFVYTVTQWLKS